MRRRRISVRRLTARLAVLSAAAALAVGALLAVQMAHGSDPALGPKAQARSTTAAPRASSVIEQSVGIAAGSPALPEAQPALVSPPPVTTRSS